jgi:hypothetical protein
VDRTNQLAALCTLSFLALTCGALHAQAEDSPLAPVAPPAGPSNLSSPPAEPGPPPQLPSPPPAVPSATAFPSTDTSPAAPSGSSPEVKPPATSAAFAPLPDLPPESPNRQAPRAAGARVAAAPDGPSPAGAPAYHRNSPTGYDSTEPEKDKGNDSNGVFGPIRVGFLIGTGLPDLLSLGGLIKVTPYFGVGANVGLIPAVKLSLYGDATVSFQEYDLYGHIFPFGGAFFMGAGVGYATVHGTLANRYTLTSEQIAAANAAGVQVTSPFDVTSQANVRTLVLTPQVGLLKTFGPGFSIGIDVGAQIPIAPSKVDFATQVPKGVPDSLVAPNDDKVRSTLNSVGRTVLPTVNFKIGWLL